MRANSKLRANEYSVPVLGLIFLRYADVRFKQAQQEIGTSGSGRRSIGKADYQARGVLYLPEAARFSTLLELPEGANLGQAVNDAMRAVEEENEDLRGVLPKTYNRLENRLLVELFKTMSSIPDDIEGDAFGKIYEYFLGNFAMGEGQRGGEFFTPTSIVKLIVEVIEPYSGRIFDAACGSGGMFVQSAKFVEEHRRTSPEDVLSIYGEERVAETIRLAKMNLAVHGLAGDIRQGNSYYEDLHNSTGRFDRVMANPPFNVNNVDKTRLEGDSRFPFGLPSVDNANYLWISLFYSALNDSGRAGFVMANSASDARSSEQTIRQKLLETGHVDVMVAVGSNFFYTVTLPCTLWFFDKGKPKARKDTVLFIDARSIYTQVSRALREFTPAQIEFLANIVRLYRGEPTENLNDSRDMLLEHFPDEQYADVAGLCKVATLADIAEQGWSLNPGRYVGVRAREQEDYVFAERLQELNEELELLNAEAHELELEIGENIGTVLEGMA